MRRLAEIIQAEQGAHRYAMNSHRRAATVLSKTVDRYQNRIKALLNPETSEELGGPLGGGQWTIVCFGGASVPQKTIAT